MNEDQELEAIERVKDVLSSLDEEVAGRVIRWQLIDLASLWDVVKGVLGADLSLMGIYRI